MVIIQTERLFLREITPDDAESAYLLNFDPEVIKYTGDDSFESVADAKSFLENYDHYKKYGFGRWAMINKETSEFIGWCGLKYTEEIHEHDIGFRLFKRFWNKGFATEASKACLAYGFEKLNLEVICGRVMKENVASVKVLEKIGLRFSNDFNFSEHCGLLYKLDKDTWKILNSKI